MLRNINPDQLRSNYYAGINNERYNNDYPKEFGWTEFDPFIVDLVPYDLLNNWSERYYYPDEWTLVYEEAKRNVQANLTEIPIYQVSKPAQMAIYGNSVGPAHIGSNWHFNQPAQNYGRPVHMGANANFNQPGQTPSYGSFNQPGLASYGNFVGPPSYRYLNGQARLKNYGQPIQPTSYGQLNGTAQLGSYSHFRGPSSTNSYGNFYGPVHIGGNGQFNIPIRMKNPGQFQRKNAQAGNYGQISPLTRVRFTGQPRILNSEPQQPARFLNSEPQQPARFLNSEPRNRFTITPRQSASAASHGQQHHQAQLLNNGQRPTSRRHHPYARSGQARNANARRPMRLRFEKWQLLVLHSYMMCYNLKVWKREDKKLLAKALGIVNVVKIERWVSNRRRKFRDICVNRTTDELVKEYLPLGHCLNFLFQN